ncbi:MAG: carboxylating nicotinate-nucleotide diphosphorylase [Methylophilus sp.]
MTTPLFTQTISHDSLAFKQLVDSSIKTSLAEDIGTGDLTAQLVPIDDIAQATIISREHAVICGIDWVNACFQELDPNTTVDWKVKEGDVVTPNQVLCNIAGNARAMLTAERTALNFLQTLSATATETKKYVDAIAGLPAQILDTRKTIPGLRMAQKYAVTVGGGHNQRLALYDGILIKENHIAVAGSIKAVLEAAYRVSRTVSIQIEVENIQQLKEALEAGAKSILLDNFNNEQLREAVGQTQGHAILEASGNVNLQTVRAIAETGVDRISIGSLTKHVKAIDLSMRIKMHKN